MSKKGLPGLHSEPYMLGSQLSRKCLVFIMVNLFTGPNPNSKQIAIVRITEQKMHMQILARHPMQHIFASLSPFLFCFF